MRTRLVLTAVWLALALGCVSPKDPLDHRGALEDCQKRYTNMIRWGDAGKAVQFVEESKRGAFLSHASDLQLLAISDYDIGEIVYGDDDKSATVEVTYRGYSLVHLVERTIHVTQNWTRESGNDWRVSPDLETVVAQLRGQAP